MRRRPRRRLTCVAALALLIAGPVQAGDYRLLRIDGVHLKWGEPVYGGDAEISYGFATRHHSFADAVNCSALAPAIDLAGGSTASARAGARGRLERTVAAAFAMWERAAGLVFTPAVAGEVPEILIGAQGQPESVAFANVWFDRTAVVDGVAPLTRATICLNPGLPWFGTAADEHRADYDLQTVLAHEIGHAIGLDHPGASGALMGFRNQGNLDALLPGDVAGALALYGPPRT